MCLSHTNSNIHMNSDMRMFPLTRVTCTMWETEPHNEIAQAQSAHDNFWDFLSSLPSAHI